MTASAERGARDAAARYIAAHADDWPQVLRALVAERSVFEAEHGITELVARHLAGLGLAPVRVAHDPERLARLPAAQPPISVVADRCSLVVTIPGAGGGRSLALNTHLDIVPEGDARAWTRPPFAGAIDAGDVMYGRGVMDDKAGVTIAMAVLETLTRSPVRLKGDVVAHFVLEDEITGNGTLLCLDAGHRADAAVIIDGTRPDRAIDRHAGQLQLEIHVSGRPAAVGVSHLGVNAADALARLVARLADAVAALNRDRIDPWTTFPSPFQLVTQRLASSASPLTVPEHADATCYMTFPPPWTLQRAQAFVEDEVRSFAAERRLEPPPVVTYPGFRCEPAAAAAGNDVLAAALRRAASAAGYGDIDVGPSTGTSDMRHFAAAGVPCLLYGPGRGFNPHRPDEHYLLSDLAPMVGLFTALAIDWCGVAAGTSS